MNDMEQLRAHVAGIDAKFVAFERTLLDLVASTKQASVHEAELVSTLVKQQVRTKSDKVWDIATKLMVPAVIAVASWAFNLQNRVAYIEATRVTALDFTKQTAQLEKSITLAQEGPGWLRNELVSVSVKLDALKEGQAKLGERVVRIETQMERAK